MNLSDDLENEAGSDRHASRWKARTTPARNQATKSGANCAARFESVGNLEEIPERSPRGRQGRMRWADASHDERSCAHYIGLEVHTLKDLVLTQTQCDLVPFSGDRRRNGLTSSNQQLAHPRGPRSTGLGRLVDTSARSCGEVVVEPSVAPAVLRILATVSGLIA